MKLFKSFAILIIFFGLTTCENLSRQEMDFIIMQEMYIMIVDMADAESCDGNESWGITPIGDKLCGGPNDYMAYNLNIDVDAFLKLVEDYRKFQVSYNSNPNYFVISDCSVPTRPVDVTCVNGLPQFVY